MKCSHVNSGTFPLSFIQPSLSGKVAWLKTKTEVTSTPKNLSPKRKTMENAQSKQEQVCSGSPNPLLSLQCKTEFKPCAVLRTQSCFSQLEMYTFILLILYILNLSICKICICQSCLQIYTLFRKALIL